MLPSNRFPFPTPQGFRHVAVRDASRSIAVAFSPGRRAAGLTIGGIGSVGAQAARLVTTGSGGSYGREYRRWILDPFEQKTGAKVEMKLGANGQWYTTALVSRRKPEIDMLFMGYPDNVRTVLSDLAIDLKVEDIPNLAQVEPVWYDQFRRQGVGLDYASYGIAWRTDLVPNPPTSWADLWKPEYQGKLAIPSISNSGIWLLMMIAARLNGGSELQLDPAFKALKQLSPGVRKYFKALTETVELLESGDAPIIVCAMDLYLYDQIDAGRRSSS
ncbi:MAG: ABC transporter substrate-binding protein [Pseudomonadota bacterium]